MSEFAVSWGVEAPARAPRGRPNQWTAAQGAAHPSRTRRCLANPGITGADRSRPGNCGSMGQVSRH
jgi:hypothetical protein